MKRHKSLIPLSHDHHRGLLLAQLIKQNAPEFSELPNDTLGKVKYALNSFQTELIPHFNNEEQILFPAAKGINNELDNMIVETVKEHRKIENIILLLKKPGDEILKLDTLGKALEVHIRKEERTLFPLIEKSLSEKTLDELEKKIKRVKDDCDI